MFHRLSVPDADPGPITDPALEDEGQLWARLGVDGYMRHKQRGEALSP